MDKNKLIRDIHKILYVFEDGIYENYMTYLSHQIISLSGLNDDRLSPHIIMLKGLQSLGKDCEYKEVRTTILGIMNDIDREYQEGWQWH